MFTGNPAELKRLEGRARELANRIAGLLDELDNVGLGNAAGQLHTPGGIIRQSGRGWTVTGH